MFLLLKLEKSLSDFNSVLQKISDIGDFFSKNNEIGAILRQTNILMVISLTFVLMIKSFYVKDYSAQKE